MCLVPAGRPGAAPRLDGYVVTEDYGVHPMREEQGPEGCRAASRCAGGAGVGGLTLWGAMAGALAQAPLQPVGSRGPWGVDLDACLRLSPSPRLIGRPCPPRGRLSVCGLATFSSAS